MAAAASDPGARADTRRDHPEQLQALAELDDETVARLAELDEKAVAKRDGLDEKAVALPDEPAAAEFADLDAES